MRQEVSKSQNGSFPVSSSRHKGRTSHEMLHLFLASFQTLLTHNKMLDKSFTYDYLYPWLGEGLLTATGMINLDFRLSR
jgi:hypothetical protein